jgi:4-hydroxy-3-polyprenylbenzoate decarboxylase
MHFPASGIFHNIVLVSIDKRYPGHARKIMSAFWGLGQLMFSKCIVVVDKDVNVRDEAEVAWIAGTHVDPARDIQIVTGPVDDLDDAALQPAFGGKMGIDATRKMPSEGFTREWPKRLTTSPAAASKAESIWRRLSGQPSSGQSS